MDFLRAQSMLKKLHIRDKRTSRMVPFQFNPNQQKLFLAMQKQYAQTGRLRLILLKARRVGMSSLTDAIFFCLGLTYSNINAQIVAHLSKSSNALFRVPRDLGVEFPFLENSNIQERRIFFPHKKGKSILDVATAGTPSAGRGETLAALHLCLRGDSLVLSNDGNLVEISKLRVGDKVWTHRGHKSTVRAILSRPAEDVSAGGECLEVRCWMNFERIVLTPGHKVCTSRGWVSAEELTTGDEIGTPIRKINCSTTYSDTKEIRDVWGRKKRGESGFRIYFDRDFGYFCGFYLAEGNVHGGQIGLAHHRKEIAFAMKAVHGVRQYISSYKTNNYEGNRSRTTVYNTALSRWVAENLGMKDEKRFPDWAFDCGESFVEGLILGYLAGDGSKTVARKQSYECPTVYVTSVRPRLLYQLRHLLASLGWGWGGITYEKGFIDKRGWNNRPSWTLSVSGHPALKIRNMLGLDSTLDVKTPSVRRSSSCKYRIQNGYLWTKIRGISKAAADTVWDIEVDHADHSFETVVGAVANSECAFYPGDSSFTSMLPAVSSGPGTMIILESTANGREGPGEAFADFWDEANGGDNEFMPLFLSWLEDPECIADEEEADDAPADDLEKELMSQFHATRAQIAWMRRTKSTQCRNMEQVWLQEYPHCPSVAFQVSGDPAFPREELAYAESTVREPLAVGMLMRSGNSYEFKPDGRGHLAIYEFPVESSGRKRNDSYYIGADAALGTDEGDFAAYAVYNGTTGDIAARFAARVHPEILADQLDMCGRWFNMALVNIELTGNLGRWAIKLLRDVYAYPNIYRWKGKDDRAKSKHKSMSLGFETTQATRRLLFDSFRYALRMGMNDEPGGLSVNDRMLMSQMSLATIKDWSWDIRHGHDDVMMAVMISVLTAQQYPPSRYKLRNKKPEEDTSRILADMSPKIVETKELWEPYQLSKALGAYGRDVMRRTRSTNRLRGI